MDGTADNGQLTDGIAEGSCRRRSAIAGGLACLGLAGCLGVLNGDDTGDGTDQDSPPNEINGPDDTSPWNTPVDGGLAQWDGLGDLEGEIMVYSGRTRDQIDPLFDQLEEEYSDLTIRTDYDDNDTQVNKLLEEGDATPADIFYTQDSGALAVVKDADMFRELPDDIIDGIRSDRTDPDGRWLGVSGRVRAIQYNTELWEGELPANITDFAYDERFRDRISTRPNSGTFRAFIVAMMELDGEEATRDWVRAMVEDQNATLYSSGSQQANAVNDGEVAVGLGNQYYAARILNEDPDAAIDVAFTEHDAGCLLNVSGIGIPQSTDNASLAAEFARHLVAAEGQEFFVEVNGEYPVVDEVNYVGELPALADIDPPEFDLNQLGLELTDASDLLREEGMTV